MKNTTAKHPNGSTSQIFKSCSWIINQIVAYDNDSWSDEFREAVRDAIKALRRLQQFF
jgi:hypothetical protein